jgi:glucose/arabinose dehydrogenase
MKKAVILPVSLLIVSFALCSDGVCADSKKQAAPVAPPAKVEKKQEPAKAEAQPATVKKPTKQEMVVSMKDALKYHPGIAGVINGLQVKEEGGVAAYMYQGKALDELDEETLSKMLGAARQQIQVENANRYDQQQRQARSIKQMNDRMRAQRTLKQSMPNASRNPKTYTPPKPYVAPKTYNPPKTYAPPRTARTYR